MQSLFYNKFSILILVSIFIFSSCSKDKNNDPNPFAITIETSDFSVTMDENPENGDVIGTIFATTNEGSVTFLISEQTPENAFTIDQNTGELTVLNKVLFNFETNPIITGNVKVYNGIISKNASVTITLNDVVDVYNGGITLFTQEEVDTFGANNYEIITGGITIGNINNTYSNITDLGPLSSLKSVGQQINLAHNNLLENLNGLNNLEEVGGYFLILNNPALNDISALSKITSLNDYLSVENNNQLTNLNGFQNLTLLEGTLKISDNDNLTSISSLQNVTKIGGNLSISTNTSLLNINLASLTDIVGRLDLRFCPEISNLDSLENLETVGSDLIIFSNLGLINFCGLQNLLVNEGLQGNYTVSSNAYNPTKQDIINGDCSL